MLTALSVQGVVVRLTAERWEHILVSHPELRTESAHVMEIVAEPDLVVEGPAGEFLAVRMTDQRMWLIVVYRVDSSDGFVITAFRTARRRVFERWEQVWP